MTKRPTESGEWSRDSAALFRSAKTDHAPSVADRERVRQALARRLAAVDHAPASRDEVRLESEAPSGATATALSSLVKVGIAIAFVATGAFAVLRASDSAQRKEAAPTPSRVDGSRQPQPAPAPVASATLGSTRASAEAESAAVSNAEPTADALASNRPESARAPKTGRPRAAVGQHAPTSRAASSRAEPPVAAESSARATWSGASDVATNRTSAAASADTSVNARASASATGSASAQAASRERGVARVARTAEAPEPRTTPSSSPPRTLERAAARKAPELSDARAELALVQQIHAALRREELSAALSLCAEHERRWPEGSFVQEREGLRAIASCRLGEAEAAGRTRTFLGVYPRSPLAARVRVACASRVGSPPDPRLVLPKAGDTSR